jgi:hypothetical protein
MIELTDGESAGDGNNGVRQGVSWTAPSLARITGDFRKWFRAKIIRDA